MKTILTYIFLAILAIKPFAYFPELRLVIANGRTLCIPCHKKTDTYLSKATKFGKLLKKYEKPL